jgi:hypothetical protein
LFRLLPAAEEEIDLLYHAQRAAWWQQFYRSETRGNQTFTDY